MNTAQASQVGTALTRLTGKPVYVERKHQGNQTLETFTGTLKSWSRKGFRQDTLVFVLQDVHFSITDRRENTAAEVEVEVSLKSLNTATIEPDGVTWTTKSEHLVSFDERCDAKIGKPAEEFQFATAE